MRSLKRTMMVSLLVLLAGCAARTEFGRKRPVTGTVTMTDERAYRIIDTAKLYEVISAVELPGLQPLGSVNKTYLKFYANGRVGTFYAFRPAEISTLDPRKAEVGYYAFDGQQLTMRSFFEHPQGGGWVKGGSVSFKGDTLQLTNGHLLLSYRPITLPAGALVYRPDW